MDSRSAEGLGVELERLMLEQVESWKTETFLGISEEVLRKRQERLERIREISADYLAALKRK